MRRWMFSLNWSLLLLLFAGSAYGSESAIESSAKSFSVPLESGDEIGVNVFPATFADSDKPLLIWFTEAYASAKYFKQLVTQLNDAGFSVWQVDLLDSYFLRRTKSNVRGLTGEGIAAVLEHANQQKKPFVTASTGRMSLTLLRGVRLWQLNFQPENGIGHLQQAVTFFPNFYESTEKAGDKPPLYPTLPASSLPLTIVQTNQGRYTLKVPEMVEALEANNSRVTVVRVPEVRDWYFLKNSPNEVEIAATNALPEQLEGWLVAGLIPEGTQFQPSATIEKTKISKRLRGVVPIDARPAPNFVLTDIYGQTINLEDKQGKIILLNFWASWCPPCVKEIPSMNRLAQSFDADKFEIVSVNFKETPQVIEAFLKKVKVDFPVLIDLDGAASANYEIFSFPSSFLIDANGQMRYSVNAAIEWDDDEVKETIHGMMESMQ